MKLFNCKMRLAGNPLDEVRKYGVTSAEITLLKNIHGADAIAEISAAGEIDREAEAERERLEMAYGERAVTKVFGAPQPRIEDEIGGVVETPELDVDLTKTAPRPRRARADELPPPPAAARAAETADAFA